MSLDLFKNFAKVTVSTGYNSSATSIVLTTGHGAKLPAVPFNAVWYNATDYPDPADDPNVEIVRVTAISTDTLTVTRGQESITATTKNTASKTYKMLATLTAKAFNADLQLEQIGVAVSDETTALTTGTAKVTFRMPFAMVVSEIRANVNTVSSSGLPTFNVKKNGTTVFSTKVTIDASEKTSVTAATPAVLSATSWADDDEITVDIDVAGTGTKGAKLWIIGRRA